MDWLADLLIDSLTDEMDDLQLADQPTDRLVLWTYWLSSCLADLLTDWLAGWLADWLTCWVTD